MKISIDGCEFDIDLGVELGDALHELKNGGDPNRYNLQRYRVNERQENATLTLAPERLTYKENGFQYFDIKKATQEVRVTGRAVGTQLLATVVNSERDNIQSQLMAIFPTKKYPMIFGMKYTLYSEDHKSAIVKLSDDIDQSNYTDIAFNSFFPDDNLPENLGLGNEGVFNSLARRLGQRYVIIRGSSPLSYNQFQLSAVAIPNPDDYIKNLIQVTSGQKEGFGFVASDISDLPFSQYQDSLKERIAYLSTKNPKSILHDLGINHALPLCLPFTGHIQRLVEQNLAAANYKKETIGKILHSYQHFVGEWVADNKNYTDSTIRQKANAFRSRIRQKRIINLKNIGVHNTELYDAFSL